VKDWITNWAYLVQLEGKRP